MNNKTFAAASSIPEASEAKSGMQQEMSGSSRSSNIPAAKGYATENKSRNEIVRSGVLALPTGPRLPIRLRPFVFSGQERGSGVKCMPSSEKISIY